MSTSSEEQSKQLEQSNAIKALTEQVKLFGLSVKNIGKDLAGVAGVAGGKLSDATKTISKTGGMVVDAAIDEIPGGKLIQGMVGDMSKYFTGLKERSKKELEENKEIIKKLHEQKEEQKKQSNESKRTTEESTDKILDNNDSNTEEVVDAIKDNTEEVRKSNEIEKQRLAQEKIAAVKDKDQDQVKKSTIVKPNDKIEPQNDMKFPMGFGLRAMMGNVVAGISKFIKGIGKFLLRALSFLLRGGPIIAAITAGLLYFKDDIIKFFRDGGFKDFVNTTKELLVNAWNNIVEFFINTDWKQLAIDIFNTVKPVINDLVEIGSVIAKSLWDNIVIPIWDWIKEKITAIWTSIKTTIGSWYDGVVSWISEFGTYIDDKWTGIKSFFTGMWDLVIGKFTEWYDGAIKWTSDLGATIGQKWESVKSFVTSIPDKLMEPVNALMGWFRDLDLGGTLKSKLSGIGESIIGGVAELYNMTIGNIPLIGKKMLPNGTIVDDDTFNEFNKLKESGKTTQEAIDEVTILKDEREIQKLVEGGMTREAAQQKVASGKTIMGTISNAASSAWSGVTNTASSVGSKISSGAAKISGGFTFAKESISKFLKTNTNKNNSLPSDSSGKIIENNLARIDEQIWQPISKAIPGAQINSAFRSKEVNSDPSIKGAINSDHTDGRAIDIGLPPGMSPIDLANNILALNLPFSKLIVEPSWVHMSIPKEGETVNPLVWIDKDAAAGKTKSGKESKFGAAKLVDLRLPDGISGAVTRQGDKLQLGNRVKGEQSNYAMAQSTGGNTITTADVNNQGALAMPVESGNANIIAVGTDNLNNQKEAAIQNNIATNNPQQPIVIVHGGTTNNNSMGVVGNNHPAYYKG